ncbi:ribonuclease HII [Candidatus Nitrotoga fabula]|uniref:Ribonuclease HII n=1 Tax=Candidatus Nitrotoga fabula TaxID=2182327 RepID=A0A916BBP7_9PROT|nr:ribonuclease HII [Candidatus Nitrotoga fabula]CAE6707216.1 RNase HII [Candidatus Nitrotoga fabula]
MKPSLLVCGVDESGRGPLAGPVFAAAVILDDSHPILGLDDSKKLSEKQRNHLALEIKQHAIDWAIAEASVQEIDTVNIFHASLLAMRRAVEKLQLRPQEVLVDGLHCPDTGIPSRAIVQGDSSVASISAASILAKTARDAAMLLLHETFPQYGFAAHKGYATKIHLAALKKYGATHEHRNSFRPVREILQQGMKD